MNFLGHAAVAAWVRPDPAFVLGAMLPDFCSMVRARLLSTSNDDVDAGIAFHHQTDAAFHSLASFVRLTSAAFKELLEGGVGRGPARAAAHVSTELLLDAVTMRDPAVLVLYVDALDAGAEDVLGRHLRFEDDQHAARWARLRLRLRNSGLPSSWEQARIADRLSAALACRPKLALDERAEQAVGVLLPRWRERVEGASEALFSELSARLGVVRKDRAWLGRQE